MNEWMHGWMEWMHGWMGRCMDMDRWIDRWKNGWMNGWEWEGGWIRACMKDG